jgi:hypothetical protein
MKLFPVILSCTGEESSGDKASCHPERVDMIAGENSRLSNGISLYVRSRNLAN